MFIKSSLCCEVVVRLVLEVGAGGRMLLLDWEWLMISGLLVALVFS